MTVLLDANVLIALTVAEHEHHDRASAWLADVTRFSVCPIVEGALVRFLLRVGERPETAAAILQQIAGNPRHEFLPDDLSYRNVNLGGLQGHRQVTDAYLVALAEHHGSPLATFDQALAAAHPDAATLIP